MSAGEIKDQEKLIAQNNFVDFVEKPFKPEELIQKITEHFSKLLAFSE